MKKILFLVSACSFLILELPFTALSQSDSTKPYWQQEVNYRIDVALNDKDHSLKGNLNLVYTNNSPDQLDYIWFHLWPNAYKNQSTAYAKQILRDPDGGKKRWDDMKDKGSIDGLDFKVNGQTVKTEPDPENIDILKVVLSSPLAPGEKITITTPFEVKLPTYSSRSGHLDQSYMVCQWYPKPAVYDRKGWHQMPYLDQGEFYSEFGTFDVTITVPSAYVIGATGQLQNATELATYKQLGQDNNSGKEKKYKTTFSTPTKSLQYKGQNIHDFAWFADKEFIVRYDTAQLASGAVIDVFTYGYEKGNPNWKKSVSYVEDAIRHYSNWIGEYPYPVAQAVEGPRNVMSGGMEYPMITLITSPNADEPELDAVIAHEVGHNWFYGIIASNERQHAWMDEGMNTYFQFRYEAEKYRGNSIFGNGLPEELKQKPVDEFQALIYGQLSQIPMDEPIETSSEDFKDKEVYGIVVYLKTAIWMYIAEMAAGKDNLNKVIQSYYADWKFKHPYPEDLQAEFKKVLNQPYNGLFELLHKKGKFE